MKRIIMVVALVLAFALVHPVAGAGVSVIHAGDTVFIGEQGLDISPATGVSTQIAWFPSTASSTSTAPEKIIDVSATKTSFSVGPVDFSSRQGNWYCWSAGWTAGMAPLAFYVNDPSLSLRVEDSTVGVDVTANKWIYRGDEAKFRIETNMYTMGGRIGSPGANITIKVQTPDGAVLTSLTDAAGRQNSLVEIPVAASPHTTGAFWDTGNALYSPGTYTIWAECNSNGIKDNYNVEGKTVSVKTPITVTEFNPLIKTAASTTVPVVTVTTRATTAPPVTAAVTTAMTTVPVPATTTQAPETVPETTAPPATPAPAQTYADGFTALAAVAACGAAAVLVFGRFR